MTMTDDFSRLSNHAASYTPSSTADSGPADASSDCLRLLLSGGEPQVADTPSGIADRLTLDSRAFIQDLVVTFADADAMPDETAEVRIDPPAAALLGWTDDGVDPGDQFAARLMAAFQSGALASKSRTVLDRAAPSQISRRPSGPDQKRQTSRGHAALRVDKQHQRYTPGSTVGRPLYTPW